MEQYNVTGMSCAACSARVEKVSRAVPGEQKADVNLLAGTMVVSSDTDVSALVIQAVQKAGYNAALQGTAAKKETASPMDTGLKEMKHRLIGSSVFLVVLMYFTMGHMVGLPVPGWYHGTQNAVVAAEALGLGSCYIGDIVENAEEVAELLDLPPYTMPLSMLIIGTPRKERPAIAHPVVNLVHEERYCRADAATMDAQVAEMDAMFRPHARVVGERVVDIYTRKHTSPFMAEMSRSMEWWFKNWLGK